MLDQQPLNRYEGSAPEPRPGLSSGHIPHSLPAPFLDYLLPASENKPYTSLRPLPELKEVLAKAVGGQEAWDELAKGQRDVVFTCGSGMSAAIGWLVNEMIRMEEGTKMKSSIYDEVSDEWNRSFKRFRGGLLMRIELDGLCIETGEQDCKR